MRLEMIGESSPHNEELQLAEASFHDMRYSAVSQTSRDNMVLIEPMTVAPTWQELEMTPLKMVESGKSLSISA